MRLMLGRIQELRKDGSDGERRAQAYNGGLGAEPLVTDSGGSPLKPFSFTTPKGG